MPPQHPTGPRRPLPRLTLSCSRRPRWRAPIARRSRWTARSCRGSTPPGTRRRRTAGWKRAAPAGRWRAARPSSTATTRTWPARSSLSLPAGRERDDAAGVRRRRAPDDPLLRPRRLAAEPGRGQRAVHGSARPLARAAGRRRGGSDRWTPSPLLAVVGNLLSSEVRFRFTSLGRLAHRRRVRRSLQQGLNPHGEQREVVAQRPVDRGRRGGRRCPRRQPAPRACHDGVELLGRPHGGRGRPRSGRRCRGSARRPGRAGSCGPRA